MPDEWHIKDAYIITPSGKKICDFKKNNLHILNYSTAINTSLSLEQLQNHLYSREDFPEALPYYTSYYKKRWGFCITHKDRIKLQKGQYKVFIDSFHDKNGVLDFADFILPSTCKNKDEILFSSYLCHPSMANNELSGPVVACFLAKYLKNLKHRKYTYRFVFIPESIGSIVYINQNLKHLQKHTKAGFVLSCMGDEKHYSLIQSPTKASLADKIALHTLKNKENFTLYDFSYRGSDERQYCSVNVNLPVVTLCRTRFGDFKEYHTHFDNLDFISAKALEQSLNACIELVKNLENNAIYKSTCFCEPNLGKRGLYPTLNLENKAPLIADFLAFCDGKNDLVDIATILNTQAYEFKNIIKDLLKHKLIKEIK